MTSNEDATIDVVQVTAERWQDLSDLFCRDSATNTCWCMWPRYAPRSFQSGEGHQAEMREIVFAGRVPGLLARVGGRAIGWCAVGPLREFPQYSVAPSADPGAWGIACLYVSLESRGIGASRALIEGAVAHATAGGASIIHGPPPWWNAGGVSAAAATAAAFVAAGFRIRGEGARMLQLEFRLER